LGVPLQIFDKTSFLLLLLLNAREGFFFLSFIARGASYHERDEGEEEEGAHSAGVLAFPRRRQVHLQRSLCVSDLVFEVSYVELICKRSMGVSVMCFYTMGSSAAAAARRRANDR